MSVSKMLLQLILVIRGQPPRKPSPRKIFANHSVKNTSVRIHFPTWKNKVNKSIRNMIKVVSFIRQILRMLIWERCLRILNTLVTESYKCSLIIWNQETRMIFITCWRVNMKIPLKKMLQKQYKTERSSPKPKTTIARWAQVRVIYNQIVVIILTSFRGCTRLLQLSLLTIMIAQTSTT